MRTYLYVLSFLRPYKALSLLYVLCTLLYIAFSMMNLTIVIPLLNVLFDQKTSLPEERPEFALSTQYIGQLFNYSLNLIVTNYGKWGALQFICIVLLASTLLGSLSRYFASVFFNTVSVQAIQQMRASLFEQIIHLPIRFFTERRRGDTLSRLTNDVREVESLISGTFNTLVKDPIMIIGYLFILFSISWQLSLIVLLMLPLLVLFISFVIKRLRSRSHEHQDSLSVMTSIIEESLEGISVVKAFTAEQFVINKFKNELKRYIRLFLSIIRRTDAIPGISDSFGAMTLCLLLIMGGFFILVPESESKMTASSLIAFLIIITQMFSRGKGMFSVLGHIQKGLAATERIISVSRISESLEEHPNSLPLRSFEQSIELKGLHFAYEEEEVLRGIDLKIEKNKVIAVVGPSGAGKSTLSRLIPRFYDPTRGQILLDGIPMTSYKTHDLRALIGIVPQEVMLFHDTIAENIAFGKPNATQEEIERAAHIANAHDFIMQQPLKYKTIVGDSGIKLSGGQRQRVNIARAVLKNPPILILDEATSSLDSASEQQVQQALEQVMKKRTCLIIAHRLSTVQHADEIIVLDKGHISAQGTHSELLKSSPIYKNLIELQSFH